MSGIFVSYRRASSAACAYRLVDELKERFGDEAIFFDVESIDPGIAFAQVIRNALAKCSVALIVIGPQWSQVKDEKGNRRLDNADDWVRHEVQAALNSRARVIPLLVEGAEVPAHSELPEDIQELAGLQAFTINKSPEYWDFDIQRLEQRLRKIDKQLPGKNKQDGNKPRQPESSGGFSKKVICGYVIAGLFGVSLTTLATDADPINTSYGFAFFFGLAFLLHGLGLSDINKGLTRGKGAAIGGMVASVVLAIVALAMGAMLDGQVNGGGPSIPNPVANISEQKPPFQREEENNEEIPGEVVEEVADDSASEARAPNLAGTWSSNIGSSYQFGNNLNGTVFFYEFNAAQLQVGYAEGSYGGDTFTFDYFNSLLGTTGQIEMVPDARNANLLRGTYYDQFTGQSMNFELYRAVPAGR